MLVAKVDLRLSGLKRWAEQIKKAKRTTEVGFFEESTYDDGTKVAYVAYLNEYGQHNPPRPFMRRTVEKQMNKWTKLYCNTLKRYGVTPEGIEAAQERIGIVAVGDMQKTIKEWSPSDPRPNKPATIRAKERKSQGNDPGRVLHDTGTMINSIKYKVVSK